MRPAKLTRYWSLAGSETVNLTNSTNLINGVATPQSSNKSLYATLAAIYQDECMAFISALTQSGIRSGDVTPRRLGHVQRRVQEPRRIRRQYLVGVRQLALTRAGRSWRLCLLVICGRALGIGGDSGATRV